MRRGQGWGRDGQRQQAGGGFPKLGSVGEGASQTDSARLAPRVPSAPEATSASTHGRGHITTPSSYHSSNKAGERLSMLAVWILPRAWA